MPTKITGIGADGLPSTGGDTGTMEVDGSLTIGNADTDVVVFNADIGSNIIPDVDDTYNFGSMAKAWSSVYSSTVQVQTLTVNGAFTFPTSDGTANQVLKTDGNGSLTWQNEAAGGGGSPAGSDEEIQINNSGSFGASSNLTFGSNEFVVAGAKRQCDVNFASSAEKLRSFTYKQHIQFTAISANTWHDVITFQPYISGTTNNPESNTFYSTVAFRMEIFGNTGGVGSGYRSRMGSVQFNGSSAASANATDTTLDNPVSTRVDRSGWVTKLQINPDQAGATNFTGVVYLEIYFGRGQGSNGNNIEWSIT